MRYDYGELYRSKSNINNAKSLLEEGQNTLEGIGVLDTSEISASIKSVKSETGRIINTLSRINAQISTLITKIEDAEKSNCQIVDNLLDWKRTLIEQGIVSGIGFDAVRGSGRQRILDIALSFAGIPDKFKVICPQEGTIIYDKDRHMQIYLPYGYSTDDQYDVLVLLHGDGGNETTWLSDAKISGNHDFNGKTLVDNMIYYGKCDPLIVVTIAYASGESTSYPNIQRNLEKEYLPYIAANYSTYAVFEKGSDLETQQNAIMAARDHFGIAGFSRGGMATERLITTSSDYFSWFGCFSEYEDSKPLSIPEDKTINYLYLACGDEDPVALRYMEKIYEHDISNNPNVSNSSIDTMSGGHSFDVWYTSLYNMLQLFYDDDNNK